MYIHCVLNGRRIFNRVKCNDECIIEKNPEYNEPIHLKKEIVLKVGKKDILLLMNLEFHITKIEKYGKKDR